MTTRTENQRGGRASSTARRGAQPHGDVAPSFSLDDLDSLLMNQADYLAATDGGRLTSGRPTSSQGLGPAGSLSPIENSYVEHSGRGNRTQVGPRGSSNPTIAALQRDFGANAEDEAARIEREQRELLGPAAEGVIPGGRPLTRQDIPLVETGLNLRQRDQALRERDQGRRELTNIADQVGRSDAFLLARELASMGVETGGLGDFSATRESIQQQGAAGRESALREASAGAAGRGGSLSPLQRAEIERSSRAGIASQLSDLDLRLAEIGAPYRQQSLQLLGNLGQYEDSERARYREEAARALLDTEYEPFDLSGLLAQIEGGFVGR